MKFRKMLICSVIISLCFAFIPTQTYAGTTTETEPNETMATANLISLNTPVGGEIGSYTKYVNNGRETDIDYFKVYLESGITYEFDMDNFTDYFRETSLIITLISPSNSEYGISYHLIWDEDSDLDYCTFTAKDTGYYYIKLYNYFSRNTSDNTHYAFNIYKLCDIYGHNWDDGSVISEATYTSTGKIQYACLNCNATKSETIAKLTDTGIPMYRLYNPNSGEHFYTANAYERDSLKSAGWNYEGIAWYAPHTGNPVYRLYNENAGDHHYTLNSYEKDNLVAQGWKYEGVAWYSGGSVKMYRAYNPNAKAGSHHYTKDTNEINSIVAQGWRNEGLSWYAIK